MMMSQLSRLAPALALIAAFHLAPASTLAHDELELRPFEVSPQPLRHLHPHLAWMTRDKLRAIWMRQDLFAPFADSDKTVGAVLRETGFNLVILSMDVNSDNNPSGEVDATLPIDERRDRTRSNDLDTRLAPNIEEARRAGLKLMIGWKYGSNHLEPYRKARNPQGQQADITCCPVEEQYIAGQHIGNWAVAIARGGADGMLIDMEMYHSDTQEPDGYCTCDECFQQYLEKYHRSGDDDWRTTFVEVSPETRGDWLAARDAELHYITFMAQRVEALYDSIRRRCQEINPTFFFGVAPQLTHFPGVERGLGTDEVPCLVFGEHEYPHGPYRGTLLATAYIRDNLPALHLSGAYVAAQSPQQMARHITMASVYSDGWFAWYGNALVTDVAAGEAPLKPYGRVENTSAHDYLSQIAAAHDQLDTLLASPSSDPPPWRDGLMAWHFSQVAQADAAAALSPSEEAAQTLRDARAALQRYFDYCDVAGVNPYWYFYRR